MFLTNDLGQTFPMTQIATEGGLLAHPIRNVQTFTLAMAERVEVVVDFADPIFAGQQVIYIENRLAQTDGRKPDEVTSSGTKLLKFVLGNPEADPSQVPDTLRPFAAIGQAELDAAFNPHWGPLFREGREISKFGEQVEAYACVYTSRVSNFRFHSPNRCPA